MQERPRKNELSDEERFPHLFSSTLANSVFKYELISVMFRGEMFPSTYRITVKENETLHEGQKIGHTLFGQTLYWESDQVVSRGR